MSTGDLYAGFFPKRIVGSETFEDDIFEAGRTFNREGFGSAVGEAVFNVASTASPITASADGLNDRKLSVGGTNKGMTGEGDLMTFGTGHALSQIIDPGHTIDLFDPDWFDDLPFENANATTYRVYASLARYPVDIAFGADSSRGYGSYVDVVGIEVTPDVVDVTGDVVVLRFGAALTTGFGIQPWLTSNTQDADWSYDCAVYLDTDTTGVSIASDDPDVAIAYPAKLTKNVVATEDWEIDISAIGDGKLGQTAPPSSTPADYKVTIFGPIITTTDFDANDTYIHIGTSTSAGGGETISTAAQIVTPPMNSFTAGFDVEHVTAIGSDLGRHKTVTAEATTNLDLRVDSAVDEDFVFANIGAGGYRVVIGDTLRVRTVINVPAQDIDIDLAAATRSFNVNVGGLLWEPGNVTNDAQALFRRDSGGTAPRMIWDLDPSVGSAEILARDVTFDAGPDFIAGPDGAPLFRVNSTETRIEVGDLILANNAAVSGQRARYEAGEAPIQFWTWMAQNYGPIGAGPDPWTVDGTGAVALQSIDTGSNIPAFIHNTGGNGGGNDITVYTPVLLPEDSNIDQITIHGAREDNVTTDGSITTSLVQIDPNGGFASISGPHSFTGAGSLNGMTSFGSINIGSLDIDIDRGASGKDMYFMQSTLVNGENPSDVGLAGFTFRYTNDVIGSAGY